ncbi:MAG: DUF4870 family protein [Thiomicrospira sp.]|jgi:uncharacterized membrane protein
MSEVMLRVEKEKTADTMSAKIVYGLYLVGLVIGITAVIGLVLAYVKRGDDDTPEWLNSHYTFQIRTFWYGLVYLIIGGGLSVVFIGWLVLLFWLVWLIIRCIKGFSALDKQQSISGGFFAFGEARRTVDITPAASV